MTKGQSMQRNVLVGLLLLIVIAGVAGSAGPWSRATRFMAQGALPELDLRVLGAVAAVAEDESGIQFVARVDTGARTCSLHTAEKQVAHGSPYMEENLGKIVRFRVENNRGQTEWIERPIVEVRKIRTSEGEETRYLVPMLLTCNQVEREVLVSLNDRSEMTYTMLLGRNFLEGQFVVDVTGADALDAQAASPAGHPDLLAAGK
jgi:hypothetical protein